MKMKTGGILLNLSVFLLNSKFFLATGCVQKYGVLEYEELVDDMIFSPHFNPRFGCVDEKYRWPNATVVFNMTNDFKIAVIRKGMELVSNGTCIKFREKSSTDSTDVVEITKEPYNNFPDACAAEIGRKGRLQYLHLPNSDCIHSGLVAHELMHTLGVLHEHQRPDRDNYITIHWDNIREDAQAGFETYNSAVASTFDLSYDRLSIMHYDNTTFAVDPSKPTMTCQNSNTTAQSESEPENDFDVERGCELGQQNDLTELDKQKLRKMYNCHPDSP